MDAKTIFDHFLNAASAALGDAEAPRRELPKIPKLKQSGGSSSCCIAKRPAMGSGKLPEVRKPGGE